MGSRLISRTILCMLLIFAFIANLESVKAKPIKSYVFAVQVQARFFHCETGIEIRSSNLSNFNIHGLWPQPNENRNNISFNISELDCGLISKMRSRWQSLKNNQSNEEFWKYQWNKHGKSSNLSLSDYFKAAVELTENSEFQQWLKNVEHDLENRSKPFNVTAGDYLPIFKTFLSVESIQCYENNNSIEIRFRMAANASEFVLRVKEFYIKCDNVSQIYFGGEPSVVKRPPLHRTDQSSNKRGRGRGRGRYTAAALLNLFAGSALLILFSVYLLVAERFSSSPAIDALLRRCCGFSTSSVVAYLRRPFGRIL